MVNTLQKQVWKMCYDAQQHLSLGYCTMLIRKTDFQYSYRLWIEDFEGNEIPLEQPIVQNPTDPLSPSFYTDLIKKTRGATKCYELYTLCIGMLSVSMVASHERSLQSKLKPFI